MSPRLHRLLFGWAAFALFFVLVAGLGMIQRRLWDPPFHSFGGQALVALQLVAVTVGLAAYVKLVSWLASRFPAVEPDETSEREPRVTPLRRS